MRIIADLHIHSLFSRATSKTSHLRGLAAWAAVKGIDLVATGDFTHPGWFAHIVEELEPAEPGLFKLRPDPGYNYAALLPDGMRPARHPEEIRFLLGTEISCIYKRAGKVRKVHNLIYAPDLDTVRRLNTRLADLGNIKSDGRPILGMDSRDLLEIALEASPDCFFIPAHIWTPWFSLFGSKSGFDRIEDCFGNLTPHIFALETGLSSDPAMNRLLSALDGYTLVSNSDCHSPAKLGREVNIFDTEFSYFALRDAIKRPHEAGQQRFQSTVEFFPEEGKYHADGHRKCGARLEPQETNACGGLCPVCGKPLTVGVLHRVLELADRESPVYPPGSPEVHGLVPLPELVAELLGVGPASMKVAAACARLVTTFGSDFALLLDAPLEDLRGYGLLAEAVGRMRRGEVVREAGYDGEFGVVRVFPEGELAVLRGQQPLFPDAPPVRKTARRTKTALMPATAVPAPAPTPAPVAKECKLNEEQQDVVASCAQVIVTQAGPGTGKTHTLSCRVARLLSDGHTACTVITFTNKAADELKNRLHPARPRRREICRIATFHSFCLELLRQEDPKLAVVGQEERDAVMASLFPLLDTTGRAALARQVERLSWDEPEAEATGEVKKYLDALSARHLADLDDLCRQALLRLRKGGALAKRWRRNTGMLFVDEFQDVNAAQYGLVAEFARGGAVFCIGDPDQAIYGFRGASPRWFHRLLAEFAAERHVLSRNYRSGATILQAATQVIRHNNHDLPVIEPVAMVDGGNPGRIHVHSCEGPLDEARFIADQIEAEMGGLSHRGVERLEEGREGAVSLADIAVLCRTQRLTENLRKVLSERGVPFRQVEARAWYMETKSPARLLYAWVLLLAGRDRVAQLLFLLGREKGMGTATLGRAQALLRELEEGEKEGDTKEIKEASGAKNIAELLVALSAAGLAPAAFVAKVEGILPLAALPLGKLLSSLAGRLAETEEDTKFPEHEDVCRFLTHGQSFSDLDKLAAHLERYSESVLYDAAAQAVTISTLHAAKGLEFDVVFLAGCEQGILPLTSREPLEGAALHEHLAEERRLFFVGMTRARRALYCTWVKLRPGFGATAERQPSSFLFEFSPELVTPPPAFAPAAKKKRKPSRQLSLFGPEKME